MSRCCSSACLALPLSSDLRWNGRGSVRAIDWSEHGAAECLRDCPWRRENQYNKRKKIKDHRKKRCGQGRAYPIPGTWYYRVLRRRSFKSPILIINKSVRMPVLDRMTSACVAPIIRTLKYSKQLWLVQALQDTCSAISLRSTVGLPRVKSKWPRDGGAFKTILA